MLCPFRALATQNIYLPTQSNPTFCPFQVVSDMWSIQIVFWGFSLFSFCGLFFMLAMLPETKGKSFASIQAQLRRDVARDNAKKLMTVEF